MEPIPFTGFLEQDIPDVIQNFLPCQHFSQQNTKGEYINFVIIGLVACDLAIHVPGCALEPFQATASCHPGYSKVCDLSVYKDSNREREDEDIVRFEVSKYYVLAMQVVQALSDL